MTDKGAPIYVKIIVVLIIIVVCFFSIKKQERYKVDLAKRGKYTIGVTTGSSSNHRSSKYSLSYYFRVKGKKYRGSVHIRNLSGIKTKRGEYIVIFDPENIENNDLLLNKPVIFHPAVLEDTGWAVVPDYILHYRKDSLKNQK